MLVNSIFVSVDAKDFDAMASWWARLLGREWDREPMPSCREWQLTDCVLFQVLDNPQVDSEATVTMHITDLDVEIDRLKQLGIDVPAPTKVQGFQTLRFTQFHDPEGNIVGLLDGE